MRRSRFFVFALVILPLLLALSGCIQENFVHDPLYYEVANNPENMVFEIGPGDKICSGGLKAKMTSGKLVLFESPLVAEDGANYTAKPPRPEGFGKGSFTEIEAWCYSEGGIQQGYANYKGRLVGGVLASSVAVYGFKIREGCLRPTESTGEPPCIETSLFDED